MDEFIVQLIARLDSSKTAEDLKKIEQQLNTKGISLKPVLDINTNKKEIQNYANQIKSILENIDPKFKDLGTNQIISALNQVSKQAETVASKVSKIQLSIDTEKYSTEVNSINNQLSKFGSISGEVFAKAKASANELAIAYENMKISMADNKINDTLKIESEEKYQQALIKTQNLLKQLNSDKDNEVVSVGADKRVNMINTLNNYLSKNTAMTEESRQKIKEWIATLASSDDMTVGAIKNINTEFKTLDATLRSSGQLGLSWTDKLKQAWKKFGSWGFATGTMMALVNQLRKMPKAVYDIDTAMTNLYKVTDETDTKYNKFLTSACKNAKELGRSVSSLTEQTANWAKLGFNIDESEELAKISSIYSNVGEVDDDTAVSDLVTAMKAFNIEADNAITIVDSLNKLGNEFATDAASLGEGLKNSASALAIAGNDINQTLAILTGGGEITQDVGNLGNALKVVSLRLRGMKGELQSIGEEYEDIEDISKIQTQIYNLSQGKVNIFNDNGTFKSTYEQLKEISEIYFDLSDPDRADLTEIMFGKNRANQGVAILQAFKSGQIQKAYEASMNAAGSAYEEQERWMESLEAKTAQFEAAFQSLSNTVVDSNMLKWFVDLGTGAISVLDAIIDKTGILLPLLSGAGIAGFIQNLDHQKVLKIA